MSKTGSGVKEQWTEEEGGGMQREQGEGVKEGNKRKESICFFLLTSSGNETCQKAQIG